MTKKNNLFQKIVLVILLMRFKIHSLIVFLNHITRLQTNYNLITLQEDKQK